MADSSWPRLSMPNHSERECLPRVSDRLASDTFGLTRVPDLERTELADERGAVGWPMASSQ